jgi:hypothetical protein
MANVPDYSQYITVKKIRVAQTTNANKSIVKSRAPYMYDGYFPLYRSVAFPINALLSNKFTQTSSTPSPPLPPFDPLDVPGMVLWLDASDSSTLTLSGSNVTSWSDKSGNGYTCSTTVVGDANPTYSASSVQFRSTSSQSLSIPQAAGNQLVASTYSIFVVATRKADGFQTILAGGAILNDGNLLLAYTSTLLIHGVYGEMSYPAITVPAYTVGDPQRLMSFDQFSTTRDVLINGGTLQSSTSNGILLSSFAAPYLGRYYTGASTGYSNIDLNEMFWFTPSVTTIQRQQMEGYLAWKWGLESTLPANHPYRNSKP